MKAREVTDFEYELASGKRFHFGRNWRRFVCTLDERQIVEAETSLQMMLGVKSLDRKTFLDVGCGSGLFSLAAIRLGAEQVHSLDYDPESVACTRELKSRFFEGAEHWAIEQGSVLNQNYLLRLGEWDVVYCWGVLHHTGDMYRAMGNMIPLVKRGGQLFLSIYNKQPFLSAYWLFVKRLYNRLPTLCQGLMNVSFFCFFVVEFAVADILRRTNPANRYSGKGRRGMKIYHDTLDWIGGYPFEVASPEEIFRFWRDRGFVLKELKTCAGRHGCCEYVLARV